MALVDTVKGWLGIERRSSSLANPSPDLLALFGVPTTASGVSVNATTALRSPTTLAAVRAISESIGGLPLHLYRRGADGARERDSDHPAAQLLAGDWCPWASSAETRTAMQLDALLHGVGYALVVRTNGQPRELHRLDPQNVTPDLTGSEPRFKVVQAGRERVHDWRDVVYILTPGSTLDRIVCLVTLAREAIGLDLLMAEHQARLFANGARPAGVLEYGRMLAPEFKERLKRSFDSAHSGGANSGKTLILEDNMTWKAQQFSSVDTQFLELRRFVTAEIAKAFKVPATMVGDFERAVWRNVEELSRQFVQHTLLPWAEVWQAGLERVLLTPEERGEYFIEAKFDDLLRGDLAGRFTAYRQAAGGSWLTPNEVRRLDNLPPIDGGDELIRQAGQTEATPAPEGQPS